MAQIGVLDVAVAVETLPFETITAGRHIFYDLVGVKELIEMFDHGTGSRRERSTLPPVVAVGEIGILQQGSYVHLFAATDNLNGFGVNFRVGIGLQGFAPSGFGFCRLVEAQHLSGSKDAVIYGEVVEESVCHASIGSKRTPPNPSGCAVAESDGLRAVGGVYVSQLPIDIDAGFCLVAGDGDVMP